MLIADDDPALRLLVSEIVKKEALVPVLATNGKEALDILRRDSDFAVAIFDVEMPHLSGPALIRYIQSDERLKNIPVMIMTVKDDPRIAVESLDAGALVFLPKPLKTSYVQVMLRMLIRKLSADSDRPPR